TIHSAAVSHGGEYWCLARRGRPAVYTPSSDSLQLSITAPPPAVLTLNPAWRKFYPTEKVTLKCEIQTRQTEWSYMWYKDGASINSALSRGHEYTIPVLNQLHSGKYSCKGTIPGRPVYAEMSKDVTLTVDGEAPKPLLTLDPPSGEIFTGDTVTLSCRVGTDPAGWEYLWYNETQGAALTSTDSSSTDGSRYTLHSAAVSHGGEYWCRAGRGIPAFYTPYSDSLQLNITALQSPVLTLNPASTKFYPTEKVTLKCEIQTHQTEWSYLWIRDGASMNSVLSGSGNEFTILAVDQSHSGIYSCKGRKPGRDVYTEKSNDVTLTVDALPDVVLTLQTGRTSIFNTERAALHCDILDRSAVWMHKWYRDGRELPVGTAEVTYEILSAVQSDSGTYTCKGQHKERVLYTGSSNMVALKVNGEAPKPLLTRDPPSGEIFTGDTVTLSCRAGTDPAGWEYLWFKKTQGAALTSTDSSSTDGSSYTIHSAAVSHGGEYWCRAGRGKPAFYTPYSDSLQLNITGNIRNTIHCFLSV
ncbi:Fc receptor-like protein 5, partial [Anguilla rostrata]|uniref:Fc receptor-like protein 5 n=1 Tax=Anguilla rostrata TaxID=7938 RepID=UPI0030D3DC53